ncbi:glycoside hydrolase family 76 protein [Sphingobacterium sp. SYP-B4668]|uniref:glycoside hydrolase family 76 protein n=1 Tax=Sphingobacterium sp. SYP-B4668 TaxID=2996035 RepID=UPI0022DDF266|nr:glycoside hydrolase family 76 protein [Sphingobacterium sp. SYP-B4668]
MNNTIKYSWCLLVFLMVSSCKQSNHDYGIKDESASIPETLVWNDLAERSQLSLFKEFWSQDLYFNQNNDGHKGFNYWWNAHGVDLLVDGYLRTKDPMYIKNLDLLLSGVYKKNGNTMWNTFYDDMEWMGIAALNAYGATGDVRYKDLAVQLWNWIKVGWSDVKGGGIAWASGSKDSKNACSNAPAIILVARLYQLDKNPEYLEWTHRIYNWMEKYLIDNSRGVVWDAYGNFNEDNLYTYNQGTFIGAALELYKITKDVKYKNTAIRTANYVINDRIKFSVDGVLKEMGGGTGDGGLFKGIFIRYFTDLIIYGDLDIYTKRVYIDYLKTNGASLWTKGTMLPDVLFSPHWREKPKNRVTDSSVHMSGAMLFEMLDLLDRKELLN